MWKSFTDLLVGLICLRKKLNVFLEKHGEMKFRTVFIYIDLKNERTSSVCNEKAPQIFIECTPETNLF